MWTTNIRKTESTVYNGSLCYSCWNPSIYFLFIIPFISFKCTSAVLARILHWLKISFSAQRNKIGFCFDDVTISMGSKRWSASMSNLISNPYLCFWSKTRSEQGFASTTKCVSEMNDMFVGNCGELIVRCIQNCLVCLGACRTRCCLVAAMCCAPSWCPSEAGTRCFVYP